MSKAVWRGSRALGTSIIVASMFCAGGMASAKVTVSLMTFITNQDDTNAFKQLATEYESGHPNTKIKLILEPWAGASGYFTKYTTTAAAGVAPDLVIVPFYWVPNFAESNLITDLSPYMKKARVKLGEYTESGLTAASWRGKVWGLPTYNSSDWWITVNKKLTAEAGVADPTTLARAGRWNWETMEELCQKTSLIDANGKVQRIGMLTFNTPDAWAPWIWGMGGEMFSADGTECKLTHPKTIQAVSMVQSWTLKKKVMAWAWQPPYNLDLTASAQKGQFALCSWWNTVANHLVANKVKWPMDIVPFPEGPVAGKNNVTTIHSLSISRQSKHKDEAFDVLAFFTGERGQTVFADELLGLPTRKDVMASFRSILKKKRGFDGGEFLGEAVQRQRPFDRGQKMDLALPIVNAGFEKIIQGKGDVATILSDTAKRANVFLARGVKK